MEKRGSAELIGKSKIRSKVNHHLFYHLKGLIDDKNSHNRVQIVVKLSMEIDPKIFNLH